MATMNLIMGLLAKKKMKIEIEEATKMFIVVCPKFSYAASILNISVYISRI